jgi:hypothetical protein
MAIGSSVRGRGINCPECAATHQKHEATRQLQE